MDPGSKIISTKKRSDENWDNRKKQRNLCVYYFSRPKKNLLVILMLKVFLTTNNSIKPFFSNKGLNTNNMMLVENNEIVREEEIIANIMNNYFTNITTYLKLKPTKIDPKANLESMIDTFQNHRIMLFKSVKRVT